MVEKRIYDNKYMTTHNTQTDSYKYKMLSYRRETALQGAL